MNLKTFFMSEDINLILNGNSIFGDFYTEKGIVIPDKTKVNSIRERMRENLQKTYGNVEIIPEQELLEAMQSLAISSNYPLVSLDEIYLRNNPFVQEYLNLSRIKIGEKTFLSTRSNEGAYLPFEKEISRMCSRLQETYGRERPHRNFAYR